MYNIQDLDRERSVLDKRIQESMESGEESILLSSRVSKFNHVNKRQERLLVLSNKNLYNITLPTVIGNLLAKVVKSIRIKRKIPFSQIYGVTVSRFGKEFTIHVPSEYDYRFASEDFRDQILLTICDCFFKVNQKPMPFFFKDDLILIDFTTTKVDAPKNIQRMPQDNPQLLDVEAYKKIDKFYQAEVIYDKSSSTFDGSNDSPELKSKGVCMTDFQPIKVLGRGAFGKVMLCQHIKTKEVFAIKSLNKENLINKDQVAHTRTEREILTLIDHPFLVKLIYAFQTPQKLFFVLPFIRGGELFQQLRLKGRFEEKDVKFYIIQIVLSLGYLHKLDYAYRDIKLENILISDDGYIKLTDFGLAKKLIPGQRTFTFVGTPDYMAPEIVNHQGHDRMVDWWSVGVLMYQIIYNCSSYEMIVGTTPFYSSNPETMYYLIKSKDLKFPNSIKMTDIVKDLITKLLIKNSTQRLGNQSDAEEILQHPWFQQINVQKLMEKTIQAPFKPQVSSMLDVNNFDEEFTNQKPYFSLVQGNEELLNKHETDFEGMTYTNDGLKP